MVQICGVLRVRNSVAIGSVGLAARIEKEQAQRNEAPGQFHFL